MLTRVLRPDEAAGPTARGGLHLWVGDIGHREHSQASPPHVAPYCAVLTKGSESKSEMKTLAYERFGRDVGSINASDSAENGEELIRKSLNISFEWSVLVEAQHIIDELQIMQEIFSQQIIVVSDFEK